MILGKVNLLEEVSDAQIEWPLVQILVMDGLFPFTHNNYSYFTQEEVLCILDNNLIRQ